MVSFSFTTENKVGNKILWHCIYEYLLHLKKKKIFSVFLLNAILSKFYNINKHF